MSAAFRARIVEAQQQCDRLLGNRNARLRFDMRLSDTVDVGGNGRPETWTVFIESPAGILASGKGHNGSMALDAMLSELRGKEP